MFKYILTFSKTGNICYISHLDLMRLFYRAIKRSGIKLGYSKGFNPHPKMSFAQPLSLGYTGLNELMEMETEEEYEPDIIRQRLAELMPEGLEIKACVRAGKAENPWRPVPWRPVTRWRYRCMIRSIFPQRR